MDLFRALIRAVSGPNASAREGAASARSEAEEKLPPDSPIAAQVREHLAKTPGSAGELSVTLPLEIAADREAQEALLQAATDANADVRVSAAELLGGQLSESILIMANKHWKECGSALLAMLEDSEPPVRVAAANALTGARSVGKLVRACTNAPGDDVVAAIEKMLGRPCRSCGGIRRVTRVSNAVRFGGGVKQYVEDSCFACTGEQTEFRRWVE